MVLEESDSLKPFSLAMIWAFLKPTNYQPYVKVYYTRKHGCILIWLLQIGAANHRLCFKYCKVIWLFMFLFFFCSSSWHCVNNVPQTLYWCSVQPPAFVLEESTKDCVWQACPCFNYASKCSQYGQSKLPGTLF